MCTWATWWRRPFGRQPDPRGGGSSPTSGGDGRSRTWSCFARWRPPRDTRRGRPTPQTGGVTSRGSVSTPPWRGAFGTGVRPCRCGTACDTWWRERRPSPSSRGRPMGAPALVILAAGVGSRYGGPKQIEPLGPGDATLLDYSVYDARRAGFGRIVVVTRPELAAAFGRIGATVALQRLDDVPGPVPAGREKPWGTGHAVLAAASDVGGPFAVVNADDFYGRDAFMRAAGFFAAGHLGEASATFANIAYPLRDTLSAAGGVNRAVCRADGDGWLETVDEVVDIRDWIVLALYGLVCVAIGLAVARRAGQGRQEFFLSGRRLSWWLLGVSLVATTFSTDTPNLVTDLVRTGGVSQNWVWWAFAVTGMCTVFFYAKLWRRSAALTDIAFYESRYSGRPAAFLRGFRAIYLGVFFNVMIMASVNLSATKIAGVMLDWDRPTAVLVGGAVTVLYAASSGLSGVVLTDFVQFLIAMVGSVMAAVVALGLPQVGGLSRLFAHPAVAGRLSLLPDLPDLSTAAAVRPVPVTVAGSIAGYHGAAPGGSWRPTRMNATTCEWGAPSRWG